MEQRIGRFEEVVRDRPSPVDPPVPDRRPAPPRQAPRRGALSPRLSPPGGRRLRGGADPPGDPASAGGSRPARGGPLRPRRLRRGRDRRDIADDGVLVGNDAWARPTARPRGLDRLGRIRVSRAPLVLPLAAPPVPPGAFPRRRRHRLRRMASGRAPEGNARRGASPSRRGVRPDGRRRRPARGAMGPPRPSDPMDARGLARLADACAALRRATFRRSGSAPLAAGRVDGPRRSGSRLVDPPARSTRRRGFSRRRPGRRRREVPGAPRLHVGRAPGRRPGRPGPRPLDLVLWDSPRAPAAAPRRVRIPPRPKRSPDRLRRRLRSRRPPRPLLQRLLCLSRRRIGLRLRADGRFLRRIPRDAVGLRRSVPARPGERGSGGVGGLLVLPEARIPLGGHAHRRARAPGGRARGADPGLADAGRHAPPHRRSAGPPGPSRPEAIPLARGLARRGRPPDPAADGRLPALPGGLSSRLPRACGRDARSRSRSARVARARFFAESLARFDRAV